MLEPGQTSCHAPPAIILYEKWLGIRHAMRSLLDRTVGAGSATESSRLQLLLVQLAFIDLVGPDLEEIEVVGTE